MSDSIAVSTLGPDEIGVSSRTAPHSGLVRAFRSSRGYAAAAELWKIARWAVLKAVAGVAYAVSGRTRPVEQWIIRLGNTLFAPMYPRSLFQDYEAYTRGAAEALHEYFGLHDKRDWLDDRCVLDLGSGLGQHALTLRAHGARRVVALEYQEEKASWFRRRLGRDSAIEVVVGAAEALPFEAGTFDTVFSHTVFEHLTDAEAALRNIRRVLKPGGRVLLSFNYLHHPGGHHLFPYIHFPWASWVVSEGALCEHWSQALAADQRQGGMSFFPAGASIRSLSEGAEIHLNKLNFEQFEALVARAGLRIVKRRPTGGLVRCFPALARLPRLKYFLVGSVYYLLECGVAP